MIETKGHRRIFKPTVSLFIFDLTCTRIYDRLNPTQVVVRYANGSREKQPIITLLVVYALLYLVHNMVGT